MYFFQQQEIYSDGIIEIESTSLTDIVYIFKIYIHPRQKLYLNHPSIVKEEYVKFWILTSF